MSKKISNFAPEMRKVYQTPITEIRILQTSEMMWPLWGSPTHVDQMPARHGGVPVF